MLRESCLFTIDMWLLARPECLRALLQECWAVLWLQSWLSQIPEQMRTS